MPDTPPPTDPFVVAFDPTMLDLLTEWVTALGLTLDELPPDPEDPDGLRSFTAAIPADHPLRAGSPLEGYLGRRQWDVEEERKARLAHRLAEGRRSL